MAKSNDNGLLTDEQLKTALEPRFRDDFMHQPERGWYPMDDYIDFPEADDDGLMGEEQMRREVAELPGEYVWLGEDYCWQDSGGLRAEDAAHERAARAIEESE